MSKQRTSIVAPEFYIKPNGPKAIDNIVISFIDHNTLIYTPDPRRSRQQRPVGSLEITRDPWKVSADTMDSIVKSPRLQAVMRPDSFPGQRNPIYIIIGVMVARGSGLSKGGRAWIQRQKSQQRYPKLRFLRKEYGGP